ncbi:MAG TPA: sigma-70 family RNA polymerase sigma factor [Pirellulales bacterium]|nr:sigma-70 family RNA polymerase sigma factor [Pirellulales bacterium]
MENPLAVDDADLQFELKVLPHLDAAYNLSRWLTRNNHDAEDVVQEACLRAIRFFATHHGENSRGWLLAIVRNTCCTWLQKNRPNELNRTLPLDSTPEPSSAELDPPALAIREADQEMVRQAVEELPIEYREVIVLRELEGMSYKEVAEIAGVPLGTVMSRLSRARRRLAQSLGDRLEKDTQREL